MLLLSPMLLFVLVNVVLINWQPVLTSGYCDKKMWKCRSCLSRPQFSAVIFNPCRDSEGSWTMFGGVASRYFMYTAVWYLLYLSFIWGSLD